MITQNKTLSSIKSSFTFYNFKIKESKIQSHDYYSLPFMFLLKTSPSQQHTNLTFKRGIVVILHEDDFKFRTRVASNMTFKCITSFETKSIQSLPLSHTKRVDSVNFKHIFITSYAFGPLISPNWFVF